MGLQKCWEAEIWHPEELIKTTPNKEDWLCICSASGGVDWDPEKIVPKYFYKEY